MKRYLLLVCMYLLVTPAVAASAYNPLLLKVRSALPPHITTVREAIDYYLEPTGYRLVTASPAPPVSNVIVEQAPAVLDGLHEIVRVQDALLAVIGVQNRLVVDHAHRLVSIEPDRY
jgi:hypothetical protein